MIRTNGVEFDSVEERNDTHDAVKGRAAALSDDNTELRALFNIGQTLAHVENNEPDEINHLSIKFVFPSKRAYHSAIDILEQQSDDDLQTLANRLEQAGVDEEFDADEAKPGGVADAINWE